MIKTKLLLILLLQMPLIKPQLNTTNITCECEAVDYTQSINVGIGIFGMALIAQIIMFVQAQAQRTDPKIFHRHHVIPNEQTSLIRSV